MANNVINTTSKANRIILISVGSGAGIILLARVTGTPGTTPLNDPGALIRIAIGTGATILILMIISELTPDIAIGLALIIGLGAALTYGVEFARAIISGTTHPGIPQPKGK